MNYLARIFLNCETVFLQGIHDSYDWHQRAWEAFLHLAQSGKGGDGQFRHFLTRLDPQGDGFRLLILSRTEPRRPDWYPADPVNWQLKPVPESLLQHARYRFGLRANPTKKVTPKGEDGRRQGQGKRVALRTMPLLEDWMLRKAQKAVQKTASNAAKGFGRKDAADIAIFGRMMANDHSLNIEGAGLFAHAFSTHKCENDIDFWTAVDDRKGD
ncbi:MAG: type I-E CRISPR-associated protein Cas6/Cse3/CasE, partial [Verrucomicrobia bacterium]|nr:type I-E CRISPR-associated protein Cas6/Cse3/CasE [Verrucomicrobiota bacterium]